MDHYCFQFFTVTLLLCKHVLLYLEVVKGEHERLFHLAGIGVGAAPHGLMSCWSLGLELKSKHHLCLCIKEEKQ